MDDEGNTPLSEALREAQDVGIPSARATLPDAVADKITSSFQFSIDKALHVQSKQFEEVLTRKLVELEGRLALNPSRINQGMLSQTLMDIDPPLQTDTPATPSEPFAEPDALPTPTEPFFEPDVHSPTDVLMSNNQEVDDFVPHTPSSLALVKAGHLRYQNVQVDPTLVNDLRRLMGRNDIGFRSIEQAYTLHRIIKEVQQHSIAVLPTGGGKSFLFLIPAMKAVTEGGVYVAVIPSRSLLDNLLDRAQKFGIPVEEWRMNEPNPSHKCSLLLISADAVVSDSFDTLISELRDAKRLRAIVLDEVHKYVSESHFRGRLTSIHKCVTGGVPIHCLTATLSPGQEYKIANALHLPLDSFEVIRAFTDRRNLHYRVKKVVSDDQAAPRAVRERVIKEARQYFEAMKEGDCGLIIVRSMAQLNSISTALESYVFHKQLSAQDAQKNFENWQLGKNEGGVGSAWMVSTSLIDTGVDCQNVTHTLFCEGPWHMEGFLQGSGRTARNRGVGYVDIFYYRFSIGNTKDLDTEFCGLDKVKDYLETKDCRRLFLGIYADRAGTDCASAGAKLCDNCEYKQIFNSPQKQPVPMEIDTVRPAFEKYKIDAARRKQVIGSLHYLRTEVIANYCPFEFITKGKLTRHKWRDCQMKRCDGELLSHEKLKGRFESQIEWKEMHTCYLCWFPHSGKIVSLHADKEWFHPTGESKKAARVSKEFIGGCLYALYHSAELRTKLEINAGQKIPALEEDYVDFIIQITSEPGITVGQALISRCMEINNVFPK